MADTPDLNSIQEQVLQALKQTQDFTIDVVRSVADAVTPIVSELPKPPFADQLPRPEEAIDASFEFIGKVLSLQHDFAKQLVQTLAPKSSSSTS